MRSPPQGCSAYVTSLFHPNTIKQETLCTDDRQFMFIAPLCPVSGNKTGRSVHDTAQYLRRHVSSLFR